MDNPDAGAPENAQDLTIFVQNLLEQMVRDYVAGNLPCGIGPSLWGFRLENTQKWLSTCCPYRFYSIMHVQFSNTFPISLAPSLAFDL